MTANSLTFARKSVSDCDLYVSINIPHSLTDFQANETLLEVQSIVSLIQLEGGKISVRFPHSPMHLLCISLYVWTLKESMRLLHACKINILGKLKFYPFVQAIRGSMLHNLNFNTHSEK